MKEPNQTYTNKKLLAKGIRKLAFSIVLIVVSTYLFTFIFLNKETLPMYLLLPLAFIVMMLTIYTIISGLRTIIKAIFHR